MFVLEVNYQCGCGMEGRIQAFICIYHPKKRYVEIEYDLCIKEYSINIIIHNYH